MPHPSQAHQNTGAATPEKRVLSVEEFGAMYGYGRTSIYSLLNAGRIQAVKDGRKTLILRDSAEAFIASLTPYGEARAS